MLQERQDMKVRVKFYWNLNIIYSFNVNMMYCELKNTHRYKKF